MKSRFGNVCFTGVLTSGLSPVNVSENTYTHGTVGISGSLVGTASNLPTWWENGIVFASTFDLHYTTNGSSTSIDFDSYKRRSFWNDASPANRTIILNEFSDSYRLNANEQASKFGTSGLAKEWGNIQPQEYAEVLGVPPLGDVWSMAFWSSLETNSFWNTQAPGDRHHHIIYLTADQDSNNYYRLTIHYHPDLVTTRPQYRISWIRNIAGVITTADKIINMPGNVNVSVVGFTTTPYAHVFISRSGGQIKIFVDGLEQTGQTESVTDKFALPGNFGNYTLRLGYQVEGSGAPFSRMDDLVITSGTTIYNGNYTVPNLPILPIASGWWRNRAQFAIKLGGTNRPGPTDVVNRITGTSIVRGSGGLDPNKLILQCTKASGFPGTYLSAFQVDRVSVEYWVRINPMPEEVVGVNITDIKNFINVFGIRFHIPIDTYDSETETSTFYPYCNAVLNSANIPVAPFGNLALSVWHKVSIRGRRFAINGVWAPNITDNLLTQYQIWQSTSSTWTTALDFYKLNETDVNTISYEVKDLIVCVGGYLRDIIDYVPEPLDLINF